MSGCQAPPVNAPAGCIRVRRDFPRGRSEYFFRGYCGVSTVLETLYVVRTAGYLTPRVLLVAQASRKHVQPGRPHHKTTQIRLPFVAQASRLHVQPGRPHHKTTRIGLPCVGHVSRLRCSL